MGFNYEEAHADAKELIEFFGEPATVVKKGNSGGYDSSGNVIAAQPDTLIDGIATPKIDFKSSEVNGSSILMGDATVFFESVVAPEIGMMITLNGETYRIIDTDILTSVGDINVYRELHIRQGQ